jgi:hypothetical protein
MERSGKAVVVSVLMGLGHLRAADPLRSLTADDILIYGSRDTTPLREYRLWRGIRRSYYFFSRAGGIPLIGAFLLRLLVWLQHIDPYYPRRDRSKPTLSVRYLDYLINKRGLCGGLSDALRDYRGPVIHTYFATALAFDKKGDPAYSNYLLICDSDFNRVWVPPDPHRSSLRYCAPCTQVRRRLLSYGVPGDRIFMTGFPLPRENIGSETGLEILKADLSARLGRLDPCGKFFRTHGRSVASWLDRPEEGPRPSRFTVMFAIGGAGAQAELACTILKSLKNAIAEGAVRLMISVGIQKRIFERIIGVIHKLGLIDEMERGIRVVFDLNPAAYLARFNACLRETDVLWTKPSELVFYSALGLPIIIAPPIGTHEELNKRWLQEIHAGIMPPGPIACSREWLIDLRESGRFAEAAWDGFLKGRKLGTFKIERLITHGTVEEGQSPLDQ